MDKSIENRVEELWRHLNSEKPQPEISTPSERPEPAVHSKPPIQPESNSPEAKAASQKPTASAKKGDSGESSSDPMSTLFVRNEMVAELNRMRELRLQLEGEFTRITAEVKKQAQIIVEQARTSAEEEVTEIRREALTEIKLVMSRIENLQKVVIEEMRTQKALNDVAILQADVDSMVPEDIQRHLDSMPADIQEHLKNLMGDNS